MPCQEASGVRLLARLSVIPAKAGIHFDLTNGVTLRRPDVPAKAGIQCRLKRLWSPAYAGMTGLGVSLKFNCPCEPSLPSIS